MKKEGNQYDEQAHCYEDLEGENSNAGETNLGGNHYDNDVRYSMKEHGEKDEHEEVEVSASKASRGKAGAKEEY